MTITVHNAYSARDSSYFPIGMEFDEHIEYALAIQWLNQITETMGIVEYQPFGDIIIKFSQGYVYLRVNRKDAHYVYANLSHTQFNY